MAHFETKQTRKGGSMNRIIFFIIVFFLSNTHAMEPISDTNLSEITGKAGITAYFDAGGSTIGMSVTFRRITWGDEEAGNKGFIHMHCFDKTGVEENGGIEFHIGSSFMAADVYTTLDNITKVRIDLPELTTQSQLPDYLVINLSNTALSTEPLTDGKNLGVLYTGGTELNVPGMPDRLEVWSH
jgi:hypothetical protein